MSYSYQGFQKEILSLPAKSAVTPGLAVTMTADGVALPETAGAFIGVVDSIRAGTVGVQMSGYVECRYAGTAPEPGVGGLAAETSGYVKAVADAKQVFRILKVDANRRTVGFIL